MKYLSLFFLFHFSLLSNQLFSDFFPQFLLISFHKIAKADSWGDLKKLKILVTQKLQKSKIDETDKSIAQNLVDGVEEQEYWSNAYDVILGIGFILSAYFYTISCDRKGEVDFYKWGELYYIFSRTSFGFTLLRFIHLEGLRKQNIKNILNQVIDEPDYGNCV